MTDTPSPLWQVTINQRWTTACSAPTALRALDTVGQLWRDDVSAGEDRATIREIHVRRMASVEEFSSLPVLFPEEIFADMPPPPS